MNKKYLLAVAAGTLMLAACGDDVTEVNEIHQDGMAVLEAGEKLSKYACDTTNVGEMLFVMDSSAAFVCDGKSWQTLKGEKGKDGNNGTSCTAKSVKNAAGLEGVEVTCGETVIDTIWNGKDGENGKPGDPGKPGDAGTSCTAKSVKNKSGIEGVEVTCGETVVDTIWNGKNGKDGQNGNNGTSCTAKSVKNAAGLEGVEVTCGGAVVDTIWNGKDGQNGNNGTSCIAEPVKNAAGLKGLEVTCGETVIDTIWNGKDGQNGNNGTSCTATVNQDGGFDLVCDGQTVGTIKNGEDGVGCTLDDEGDGKVTVSCGKGSAMTTTILYKAVCGTKPYDPKTQYCLKVTRGGTDIYSVEDLLTDARDEEHVQVYKTVKICNDDKTSCQTWMAENLNYAVNLDVQSWCGGGEDGTYNEGDCSVYGRLYTWSAVMDSAAQFSVNTGTECGYGKTCTPNIPHRGICPGGWHVPTDGEFTTLFNNVGGSDYAGITLKSASGWNSNNGIDAYGFSALPAGYRFAKGEFTGAGNHAYLWSASENDGDYAWGRNFAYNSDRAEQGGLFYKRGGLSLRCLRD